MNILHYALGFPPYRSGGLTKYVYDLMLGQAEAGHDVAMLWPGRFGFRNKEQWVRYSKKGILGSYELMNPLPVPLLSGIKDIEVYTQYGDVKSYRKILQNIQPQVIHMHTLMGIHTAFLQAAHDLHIPVLYSTHDYFGLCPKANFFFQGSVCKETGDERCSQCNADAFSYRKIRIMQSGIYRALKEPMKRLHLKRILNGLHGEDNVDTDNCNIAIIHYEPLKHYYEKAFTFVNYFHFNSGMTKSIFCTDLKNYNLSGEVITITHRNIEDHRQKRTLHDPTRFTFLGDAREDKGFHLLIKVLDDLWKEGYQFILSIYGNVHVKRQYLIVESQYRYADLKNIFDMTDALIVPSMWMETFGFTAIEAKSYAVPVVMTTHVGAQDCFTDGADAIIVEPTIAELKKGIQKVLDNKSILTNMNERSMAEFFSLSYIEHVNKILSLYHTLLNSGEKK